MRQWDRAALRGHVHAHRNVLIALAALLALGIALRLWLMLAYRPAFIGYPDSGIYMDSANRSLFGDRFRVAGYPAFLRAAHRLEASLPFTILLQHALGVATALLAYAAMVRAGVSRWLALVPAAVVLLSGGIVLLEHAVLSETLYAFLVWAGLYCTVRAAGGGLGWAAAAGTLLGLSFTVRLAGLALVPLAVLWVAWVARGGLRPRLLRAGAVALAALAIGLVYVERRESRSGESGFTTTGAYNLYGHVATFADCDEFDPPSGTGYLCDERPRSERPGAYGYVFGPTSPAVRQIGEPQLDRPRPGGMDDLRRFTRAAILGQPGAYLGSVAKELARYADPGAHAPNGATGLTPEQLADHYVDPVWVARNAVPAAAYYSSAEPDEDADGLDPIRAYERLTRMQGPVFVLLALLAIAAPFVTTGERRRAAVLFAAVALTLVVVPAATLAYDYRFALPAAAPLAAAAALGAGGIATRLRGRAARRP